jgi:hypothetical protein
VPVHPRDIWTTPVKQEKKNASVMKTPSPARTIHE